MDQGKDNNGAAERAEQLIGKTLAGRFRIDAVLGTGAMGVVYRAHHTGLRKDVALKLLRRNLTGNEEMVARFDREATAVSRLDHPNCVRVMDFGSTKDGQRFLVMEYLEGEDLAEHAEHVGYVFPPFRVVGLIMQVLAGLEHAHQHGLVHRDIKPENIFVVGTGAQEHIKLLDFGVAKVQHGVGASPLTQVGMVFGTPHYMSPEQARGDSVDARGDLYSLGIVMFALLAGSLPFDGPDPMAVLRKQLTEPPPALPDEVPGSLRYFVTRLLAKDPDDRFPDATAAIVALKRAAAPTAPGPTKAQDAKPSPTLQVEPVEESSLGAKPAAAPPPTPTTSGTTPRPRWLLPAIGIGSVVLLATVFAGKDTDGETSTPDDAAIASQPQSDGSSKPPPP
ncbi:MAG: serine/threonine protein kinase, partial [Nannocystaceae bacterium]|nr:serine/threonine protein kinase [Nannocystaceae bacterium]